VTMTADSQQLLIRNKPPTTVVKAHATGLGAPKTGRLAETNFGFHYRAAECVSPNLSQKSLGGSRQDQWDASLSASSPQGRPQ
jgi:hypothetical protein